MQHCMFCLEKSTKEMSIACIFQWSKPLWADLEPATVLAELSGTAVAVGRSAVPGKTFGMEMDAGSPAAAIHRVHTAMQDPLQHRESAQLSTWGRLGSKLMKKTIYSVDLPFTWQRKTIQTISQISFSLCKDTHAHTHTKTHQYVTLLLWSMRLQNGSRKRSLLTDV